jgi:predicted house-cleaning noncanonical NTP pyrophosphatase (MazG superfamily)
MTKSFQFSLAPEKLWQAINPWSFYNQWAQLGFVNINLGQTNHPEIEQKLLDEVGSYGKQLGRIGDALEVLIDHAAHKGLSRAETDALNILKGQLAEIRKVKQRERGSDPAPT